MGNLMMVFERSCYKDLKTEKKKKYVYPLKRYNFKNNLRGITMGE